VLRSLYGAQGERHYFRIIAFAAILFESSSEAGEYFADQLPATRKKTKPAVTERVLLTNYMFGRDL
jgi:hypothetical protein